MQEWKNPISVLLGSRQETSSSFGITYVEESLHAYLQVPHGIAFLWTERGCEGVT